MSDSEEKTDEASPRKLQKQREEGSVAQSTEGGAFLAVAFLIVLMVFGFTKAVDLTRGIFDATFISLELPFEAAVNTAFRQIGINTILIVLPVAITMIAVAVVIALIFNKGPTFAIKPVTFQFNRVSMKSGMKRVYGRRGWIETCAAVVRISVWLGAMLLVGLYFKSNVLLVFRCGFSCTADLVWIMIIWIAAIALTVFIVFAALDMVLQKSLFLHEQRMTKSEVKRERKEQQGSPEIRKERRRRMQEDAKSAGSVGVNHANMCFFSGEQAIAVRYHPELAPLPRLAAMARTPEEVAVLRDQVKSNGFPELRRDRLVAGCMGCRPGEAIPDAQFTDLAQAMSVIFGRK